MIIFWIYALKTISATYCNFTKGKLQLKFNCKLKNLILDRYESTDHFCMSFQTDIMTITSTWLRKTYDVLCLSKREEWTIFWKSYGPIWWPSSHTDHNIDMKMPPPLLQLFQKFICFDGVTPPLPSYGKKSSINNSSRLTKPMASLQELVWIYFEGTQHFDKCLNTGWNTCVVPIPFVCSRGLFVNVCKKDFILGTQSDLSTVMAFCFRDIFEARLSKKISSLIIISSVWVRIVLLLLPVCLTNLFTLSSSSLYSVTPPVTKLTSASVATATILICESSERRGEDSVWYSPQPSHASRRLGIVLPDSPALPKGTDRLLPERGRGARSFHVQYFLPVRIPYTNDALKITCFLFQFQENQDFD